MRTWPRRFSEYLAAELAALAEMATSPSFAMKSVVASRVGRAPKKGKVGNGRDEHPRWEGFNKVSFPFLRKKLGKDRGKKILQPLNYFRTCPMKSLIVPTGKLGFFIGHKLNSFHYNGVVGRGWQRYGKVKKGK